MKIAVCGSINCSDKLIEFAEKLEKLGHETELPFFTRKIKDGHISLDDFNKEKDRDGDLRFRKMSEEDLIKRFYRIIGDSEAILVVNVDKNEKKNYIGGNTFLEIGFAYVLDKKIFLLKSIPDVGYKDEIIAMNPIIINGDLSKIK